MAAPSKEALDLGTRLRAVRLYRRITLTRMAELAGMKTINFINRVELGRVPNVSCTTIARFAKVLEVDPGWLAFGTGKGPMAIDVLLAEIAFNPHALYPR